jgi:hypothetical protein
LLIFKNVNKNKNKTYLIFKTTTTTSIENWRLFKKVLNCPMLVLTYNFESQKIQNLVEESTLSHQCFVGSFKKLISPLNFLKPNIGGYNKIKKNLQH